MVLYVLEGGQDGEIYRGVSSLYGDERDAVSASDASLLQM